MAKIILQPLTKISTYDDLSRRSNITIIGNIGHLISEDEKIRKDFNKSKIGRKNMEIISELVSELYTFVNRNLAKYSDPESYWFRVYYTVEVDDQSGEILSKPTFDVELYKHIGIISGKSSGIKNKSIKVILADVSKIKLAKYFNSGLRLIAENVPLISYDHFDKFHEVPSKYREKMEEEYSYVIINDILYKIQVEVKDNAFNYSIKKDDKLIYLNDQMNVFNFILSEINMEPEISSNSTIFRYSDDEVKQIEAEVKTKYKKEDKDIYFENIAVIQGIDKIIEDNEKLYTKLNDRKKMKKEVREDLESLNRQYAKVKSLYEENKIKFYSNKDMINDINQKFEESLITPENYNVAKLKLIMNINKSIGEINKINNSMIQEIIPKYMSLEKKIYKT